MTKNIGDPTFVIRKISFAEIKKIKKDGLFTVRLDGDNFDSEFREDELFFAPLKKQWVRQKEFSFKVTLLKKKDKWVKDILVYGKLGGRIQDSKFGGRLKP